MYTSNLCSIFIYSLKLYYFICSFIYVLSCLFFALIYPSVFFLHCRTHYPSYAVLIRDAVLCIMNMLSDNNAGPQPMAQRFFVIETRRHIDLTDLFSISATLDFQR
jgi:hypothetical protein